MKKILQKLPKLHFNSPVILSMTALSLIALLLNWITHGWTNKMIFSVRRLSLANPMLYLRLFTHVLGHVDYSHFIGNFMVILIVGPMLEEKYGSKSMLEMISVTALVTGLIQVIFFPRSLLLGASGIVFMLILLSSFTNHQKGKIPVTLIVVALIYLSGEIINAIANPNDGISQMAHLIGGACGMVFGWLITKEKDEPAQSSDLQLPTL